VKYAAGIIVALLTALLFLKVLGMGLGLLQLLVVVGLGIMGYGIAEKLLTKGDDNAR
jgi:hypothetical protein